MSRPLYPMRPLTATGRVIWCIALSLFSAVLMLLWTPAHANDSEARPAESWLKHCRHAGPMRRELQAALRERDREA